MVVTLMSGKEFQGRAEAEKKKNEAEIEKENKNSMSSEKKQNIIGLSDEKQHMKWLKMR